MENQFELFKHPQFGEIRVILPDGDPFNPWFVVADVCRALELQNPSDILKRLDEDEKSKIPESRVVVDPILNIGSEKREINIVNEPGLYRLIFSSRKKEAKEFQRWVYHEVLPAIRKNGYYSLTAAPAPAVAKPAKTKNPNRVAGQKTPAGIYAAKVGDKVKIGHSHDAEKRLPHIKGRTDKTYYQTALFPRKIARLLEWACHTIFAPFALGNELFDIEYDEACRIIMTLEKLIVRLSKVYSYECDDKSLVVATKNFVEYVNLIADKSN